MPVEVGLNLGLSDLASLDAAVHAHTAPFTVDPLAGAGAEVLVFNDCLSNGGLCANPAALENEDTASATIRKAILLGIDRQAIIKAVAPGLTTVPPELVDESRRELSRAARRSPRPASTRRRRIRCSMPPATRAPTKCGTAPDGQDYRAAKDGTCLVINIGTTSDDPLRVQGGVDDPH